MHIPLGRVLEARLNQLALLPHVALFPANAGQNNPAHTTTLFQYLTTESDPPCRGHTFSDYKLPHRFFWPVPFHIRVMLPDKLQYFRRIYCCKT